ncbi:hypothetical protein GmHk_05G012031 [Glycine max]|nr:hypothetical protein GmHk_05G012031 [Glycine max]
MGYTKGKWVSRMQLPMIGRRIYHVPSLFARGSEDPTRAAKTGGPARFGPAHSGFGLYRAGLKSPDEKRARKSMARARPGNNILSKLLEQVASTDY